MIKLSEQNVTDVVEKSAKPVVIKAFATWCPHCTKMKPLVEQLEKELGNKYVFAEFDVDESPGSHRNLKLRHCPHLFL